jgi:hypothetical protein
MDKETGQMAKKATKSIQIASQNTGEANKSAEETCNGNVPVSTKRSQLIGLLHAEGGVSIESLKSEACLAKAYSACSLVRSS